MVGHRLELVRGPMAEVERTGATEFEGVAITGDVLRMQFGGTANGAADGGDASGSEQRGFLLEVREEDRVLEQRDLHGLDESVAQAACIQRGEQREVVDHGGGHGEGAGEILLTKGVDAVLDADARVTLAESRGGHTHETHAAVGGGGGEELNLVSRPSFSIIELGIVSDTLSASRGP